MSKVMPFELKNALKGIAVVLKKRFPNLKAEEVIDIATDIIMAVDNAYKETV